MLTSPAKTEFFEHLMRAHARIEERLKELERAADSLAEPARALETMESALAFFSTFGKQHQDDEEKTLFCHLRPLPAFTQMLGAFDFQHRMNETEESTLAAHVRGFARGKENELRRQAHRFVEVQRAHMLAEERALFPLAEQSLPHDVLVAMSRELRVPNA